MNAERLNQLESILLALSDQTRLRLVGLLAGGEVSVSYLAEKTGESQPKISRHLAYLRDCGVVTTRREGKWIYYGLREFDDYASNQVVGAVIGALGPVAAVEIMPLVKEAVADIGRVEVPHDEPQTFEREELEVFLL